MCVSPVLIKWQNKDSYSYSSSERNEYKKFYENVDSETFAHYLFGSTSVPSWFSRYFPDNKCKIGRYVISSTVPPTDWCNTFPVLAPQKTNILCRSKSGRPLSKIFNTDRRFEQDNPALFKVFSLADEPTTLCMFVPCGRCVECAAKRVREWSFKVEKDIKPNQVAFFCTLTYDDNNLLTTAPCDYRNLQRRLYNRCGVSMPAGFSPKVEGYLDYDYCSVTYEKDIDYLKRAKKYLLENIDVASYDMYKDVISTAFTACSVAPASCNYGFLCYSDIQAFLKRLRITLQRYYDCNDLRYFVCGEYGSTRFRPHYHILVWFTPTDAMRKSHKYNSNHRGMRGTMDLFAGRNNGRIPPLTDSAFRYLVLCAWNRCQPQALTCDRVRNNQACSKYICKYMLKNSHFNSSPVQCQLNYMAVPPIFRSSLALGSDWANTQLSSYGAVIDDSYFDSNGNIKQHKTLVPFSLVKRALHLNAITPLRYQELKKQLIDEALKYEQLPDIDGKLNRKKTCEMRNLHLVKHNSSSLDIHLNT